MKVLSKKGQYRYWYSLDFGKNYTEFTQTDAHWLLSKGYTGAYLGLYASSNGQTTTQYADFDWVHYKGYHR
jgi:alpha-N-arabinofuranosidase